MLTNAQSIAAIRFPRAESRRDHRGSPAPRITVFPFNWPREPSLRLALPLPMQPEPNPALPRLAELRRRR
jgi:hypothetical protein